MKIIKDDIFKANAISEITDEPTRFENCSFNSLPTQMTVDVPDCEFINCSFFWGDSMVIDAPDCEFIVCSFVHGIRSNVSKDLCDYSSLNSALAAGETEIRI